MTEILSTYNGLKPEYQKAKYSYSNLTNEQIEGIFDKSTNAGGRLRLPSIDTDSLLVGAFDIGWEGFSFGDTDEIVSTGHLLKLIEERIATVSSDTGNIDDHAKSKATSVLLGHTYITSSIILDETDETYRPYTAVSIEALEKFRNEYKEYIDTYVFGAEEINETYDTLKEIAYWILTEGEPAVDLAKSVTALSYDFNNHITYKGSQNALGHVYLSELRLNDPTQDELTDTAPTLISVKSYFVEVNNRIESTYNNAIEAATNKAYSYASTAKNQSYAYASNIKTQSYAYATYTVNNAIELAFAWQIL